MIERVGGGDVLDDVRIAKVGADAGDVRRAIERDHGSIEAHGHVDGGGVVGDDQGGTLDDGHELSDGGRADEIDDARLASAEFEQGRALRALVRCADDGDAGVAPFQEGVGDGGEAVGGPAFAGPAACGREDGDARGGVGVETEGACGPVLPRRLGVERHVPDGGDAGAGEQFEHAIDGVTVGWDVVAFGVAEPAEFLRVCVADAARGAGGAGEHAAAEEALGVDDEGVSGGAEGAEEGTGGAGAELCQVLTEGLSREGDDAGQIGVGDDGVFEGVLHQPIDASVRVGGAEGGQDGDRAADVAERAWADEEDGCGGWFDGRRMHGWCLIGRVLRIS